MSVLMSRKTTETGSIDWQAASWVEREKNRELTSRIAKLEALLPWLQHDSWRCDYPQRYPECCCGLDDATDKAGIPRVPRVDNDRDTREKAGSHEHD
jgi:hypothetical protein